MKPEVVVFDLGKVLLDFDYSVAAERVARRARLTATEVQAVLDASPLLHRYERGELDRKQFFAEVCAATGYRGTLAEFGAVFADIFTPIQDMIGLHEQLRRRGLPTYIFSNTNDLAVEYIRGAFPFFRNFQGYVFSYEHGVMKPQAELYQVVETLSGRRGAQLLYLDDRLENVEAGAARGWVTIHQQQPAATRARVRELGLLD